MVDWNQSCYYDVAQKTRFHREAKRRLKALAHALNLDTSDYDLRSNKAGPAISGEITLHAENLYVQVSQSGLGILIRSCNGREDYTGGRNHFVPLDWLDKPTQLAEKCAAIMKLKQTA